MFQIYAANGNHLVSFSINPGTILTFLNPELGIDHLVGQHAGFDDYECLGIVDNKSK